MIGKIIYQLLTTDSVTSPILGNRVYPVSLPQNTSAINSVVYRRRMAAIVDCDGGARIRKESATLWIMSDVYETIQTISDRLHDIVMPLSGLVQGVEVMSADIVSEEDGFDDDLRVYFLEVVIEMNTIKN